MDDGALLRMGVLCNGTQLGYLENELSQRPSAHNARRLLRQFHHFRTQR
jgi:hypothetical protein